MSLQPCALLASLCGQATHVLASSAVTKTVLLDVLDVHCHVCGDPALYVTTRIVKQVTPCNTVYVLAE